MTEREFEQLKVGDKVWYVCDWLGEECDHEKANELKVESKDKKYGFVKTDKGEFCLSGVYLTKVEAWEAEVEIMESAIKESKTDLELKCQRLDRYKAELAKAKEEEERLWVIDCFDGRVKRILRQKLEPKNIEQYYGKTYKTEQEAYEALAKFYERKLFKALEKCGYKFAICCDKNIAAVKIDTVNDEFFWGCYYPHNSHGSIRKTNVFDTLEEAEAELERRRKE